MNRKQGSRGDGGMGGNNSQCPMLNLELWGVVAFTISCNKECIPKDRLGLYCLKLEV
ncbi:hypothetical protein JYQ62_36625 [Nostoc sp. UHCC 0702]|nr:hypothetical protein JYQ62_36625 [Nostoc sp. UHCC 0702]